jgi:small-conductance mechanosensitive channel
MAMFWHSTLEFFWRSATPYVVAIAAALGFAAWRALKLERRLVRNTLGFFALCVAGQLSAALLHALGFSGAATTTYELFLIGAGVALIRLAGLFLFRVALPRLGLTTPRILEDILVILAYIAWVLVRMRYAGVELSGILATSAVITAVLAFAMQDTLGNILGGLALQLDNSIEIGDWIRLDDLSGRVVDIRWRYTAVETRSGETVIIPNSQLMKSKFLVVGSRTQGGWQSRRQIGFNVDYGVPPTHVIEIAEQACVKAEIPNVADTPAPSCVLMEFGPGYGRYVLRYWMIDPKPEDLTDSLVRVHLFAALQRADIRLAVPEQSMHVIKENERHRAERQAREVERRSRSLRSVELFAGLTGDELSALAARLIYAPFARGDVIMVQGAVSHWLYLLAEGEADVWLELPNQAKYLLNTLKSGSVFGERGMLTGEARRATITARTDVECYRLDKAGFQDIIQSRPEIAEELSRVLAERDAAFAEAMKELDQGTDERQVLGSRASTLEKIRSFFSLR